jgi:predicted ester cyclase
VNKKNVTGREPEFRRRFCGSWSVPPGMPPGPAGAIAYVSGALQKFPDLYVKIDDMIAEGDRVVVRNHWTATDSQTGKKLEFRGIVIRRIAARQIVERWAYLEAPHAV